MATEKRKRFCKIAKKRTETNENVCFIFQTYSCLFDRFKNPVCGLRQKARTLFRLAIWHCKNNCEVAIEQFAFYARVVLLNRWVAKV